MKVIRWDDDEWTQLAKKIHDIRRRHPELTLPMLSSKAQDELVKENRWSKERVRTLATIAVMEPLKKKLREIDEEYKDAFEEVVKLRAEIENLKSLPNREQILDSLTPQEKVLYFADDVFENMTNLEIVSRVKIERILDSLKMDVLVPYMLIRTEKELTDREEEIIKVRRLLAFQEQRKSCVLKKKLKIAIVGTRSEQFQKIESDCSIMFDLIELDKNHLDRTLPSFDGIVMLSNHLSEIQRSIIRAQAKSQNVPKNKIISVNGVTQIVNELFKLGQV